MIVSRTLSNWTAICVLCIGRAVFGSEPAIEYAQLPPELVAVPQNLLNLVHTEEVQAELQFSPDQLAEWEASLQEIDARWWPSRILPAAQQRKIVAELEQKMIGEVQRILGLEAVKRLRQIELLSQSSRILVRPEIATFLGLDSKQSKKLEELFAENDKLAADIASMNAKDRAEKTQSLVAARQSESKKAIAIVNSAQFGRLRNVFGKPFETAKLERIYSLAPELIDSKQWTNDAQPTLESLRGQVVLVHFYAFQCHNCVANFDHYKRWDETLKAKGVHVVGIQTPETSAEKDPERVRTAAAKEGFQFPVLIDVDNKNWNAWGNTMWPTIYVIDKKGYIRFWWQGELNWQGASIDKTIETVIDKLLSES